MRARGWSSLCVTIMLPLVASAAPAVKEEAVKSFRFGDIQVRVRLGDIARTPTKAIITPINSGKMWFGGIDGAISRAAGSTYHSVPGAMAQLTDGQAIVAKGDHRNHRGSFDHVVFVVDDLKKPLDQLVCTGLNAARQNGFCAVALPTMRLGVMRDVAGTPAQKIADMVKGIATFAKTKDPKVRAIDIVVYNDPSLARSFETQLGQIAASLK